MEDRHEGQTEETKLVSEVRKAIEHRATWMYLLLKEARKRGLDWDDFAREAVRETGCFHGQLRREDGGPHQHGGIFHRLRCRDQPGRV